MNRKNSQRSLARILKVLRNFKGIQRKAVLNEVSPILGENAFDDAGLLKVKNTRIVVSTDGIVEELVNDDPWLAGFYSVVVNVNDVTAKGARPMGYTCVISSNSVDTLKKMTKGIKYGLDKYRLQFLKGHTHPDTSFNSIDASVIGIAEKNFLPSSTAKPNDDLVLAVDLNGERGLKGWVKIFDSTRSKSSEELLERLNAVVGIAEKRFANASRDVSGPGIIGTVAMLCESSRVGATINLERVSVPRNVSLEDWLTTYPSLGFIFATAKAEKCRNFLEEYGFTVDLIGKIIEEPKIYIFHHRSSEIFMDLNKHSIFGDKTPQGST
ncbi:MAG: AIR synthase related protein [Candidatus Bathyarchaeia archaeon]